MRKVFSLFVMVSLMILAAQGLFADNPPDPGGGPTGDPVGGGSPLGGGMIIMALAGMLYGIKHSWFLLKQRRQG